MTPWIIVHHDLLSSTVSWSLLKFMSIESVMLSNHLILCHSLFFLLSIFPNISDFPMSQLFSSSGQSVGDSTLATVLPKNIQGWLPLGVTDLIFLQSKGFSRVLSSTIIGKHQFFSPQPSLWSNYHISTWLLEKKKILLYQSLSCVWLFKTPLAVAHQLLCPWDSPGKNTGAGCHSLLWGFLPTQESN